ncbi:alpha/beta fold hydrolase [Amycolatopsis anabasis]|uniref:alpha/beta fold hydrolase n=1 Tax=Amycolatopsis anabasis TaxID=1840409 RepID=UPI00131B25C6|nr:alpha/beta hydrolase [Amycolatopsis anabasis]
MAVRLHTSDGVAISVAEAGAEDAATTVVLLHGWTGDHTLWDGVLARIGGRARVLAPDFRGHGSSGPAPRGSATIDRLADDVAELVAARAPRGPLVLVGHSLGGMVMMALAERHPELVGRRVRGAMFVATSSGGLREVTFGLPAPLAALLARRRGKAAPRPVRPASAPRPAKPAIGALPVRNQLLATRLIRWVAFGRRPAAADVRATVAQVARAHRGSSAGFRRALGSHERKAALAAYRSVPTVVLAGERDRLTPLEHARVIAAELPSAAFVSYPRSGHMLPYEQVDDLAARLRTLIG